MNARLFTIIFICLIILASIVLIVLMTIRFGSKNVETPTLPLPTQTPLRFPVPTGKTIEVSGIPVKNPYISPAELNQMGDSLMVRQPGYSLVYLKPFGQFLISITASPFAENRAQAENAFLLRMGITQEQACKLKVTITTPSSINPNESGQNYPLSFCQ